MSPFKNPIPSYYLERKGEEKKGEKKRGRGKK